MIAPRTTDPTDALAYEVATVSRRGKNRTANDNVVDVHIHNSPDGRPAGYTLVSDGLGGYEAGEIASRPAQSSTAADLRTELFAAIAAAANFQNARLNKELKASREQVRRLAKKVVAVQEEERLRISRELHDEAGQALTALKFSLAAVRENLSNPVEARSQLAELMALADETMDQIRRLAHDLRPCVLDRFPLEDVLEGVCQEFARRTGLEITFKAPAEPWLSDAARVSFYRFLQETLTNAAKHAKATRIDVRMDIRDGYAVLSVADDGIGFDNKNCTAGAGLIGLRERFELLGGRVEFDASPAGACLRASVPLEEPEEAST